jgi:hypothetical protein
MMPDEDPITSSQKKRVRGLISDSLHRSFNGLSREAAQRIIEAGDKLPEALNHAFLRLGRKPDGIRIWQAKIWWDRLSRATNPRFDSFEAYLATVPPIPDSLLDDDPHLPFLTLADITLPTVDLARVIGVRLETNVEMDRMISCDPRHMAPAASFWFRAHDGRPNSGKQPDDCRLTLGYNQLAGTIPVGLALYLQYPGVMAEREHGLDLPGSVHQLQQSLCARLMIRDGVPRLGGQNVFSSTASFGSVIFRME